jgi:hypothetical protein
VNSKAEKILLVGDNPFHGISHLSQERARARGDNLGYSEHAAGLVMTSLENGANGFMFSVSETTLSILRAIRERKRDKDLRLYAIVPYAYEYVRLATQVGGVSGLSKRFVRQTIWSRNFRAIVLGLKGIVMADPKAIMEAYLLYEISRIRSSVGNHASLDSLLLHEVITDMSLALNLDWLFKSYIAYIRKLEIAPGFNTSNFAYLVNKFREWNIDLEQITVAAPFNKAGFQMNPSRTECERTLENTPEISVIAISILAAGYLSLPEATDYVADLSNIKGVAVGVSKQSHACQTFRLLRERLN